MVSDGNYKLTPKEISYYYESSHFYHCVFLMPSSKSMSRLHKVSTNLVRLQIDKHLSRKYVINMFSNMFSNQLTHDSNSLQGDTKKP